MPTGIPLAGRYEIVELLGEGRLGFIYLTRDRQAEGAARVVKTFDPRRGDEKDEELFRRESGLMQSLQLSRLPRGFGLAHEGGMLLSVQQYIPGEDLHTVLEREGAWPEARVRVVTGQILKSLADLHSLDPCLQHRDIKPENILLDSQGEIWLLDLGSATTHPQDKHQVELEAITTLQTIGYAAPELLLGLESFPSTDLYALGATVLFLLTGKHPVLLYEGWSARFAWEAPVSEGFRSWIGKLLSLAACDRPATAREALDELLALP